MSWFRKHQQTLLLVGLFCLVVLLVLWRWSGSAGAPTWLFGQQPNDNPSQEQAAGFNKGLYSIDEPASLWFIANKQRPIPASYVPNGLRSPQIRLRSSGSNEMLLRDEAASALERMATDAAGQGINLVLVSGYRSYGLQQSVYSGNVAREGQASADRTSARPGHSEHQTGLAADVGTVSGLCQLDTCFDQTPEGRWVAANAYKYGFVIRYPSGLEAIVGYSYEPWHLRYVGPELAAELNKASQTLEQFFGLPPAPNY